MVLHELATGSLPSRDRDPLAATPRELAVVIRRCLTADAAQRYQSAGELAAALMARGSSGGSPWLPVPGPIGDWVTTHPARALAAAAVVPHIIATIVNIAYNEAQIPFANPEQEAPSCRVIPAYNASAYPVCVGTACLLCWRIARALRRNDVDDVRRRVRTLGWWAIGLAALGWLPGGIVFPLAIDRAVGGVTTAMYVHFAVSFTLAGLIGIVFSYLGIQYVAFRRHALPSTRQSGRVLAGEGVGRTAAADRALRAHADPARAPFRSPGQYCSLSWPMRRCRSVCACSSRD